MKLTESQLKQIIREIIKETWRDFPSDTYASSGNGHSVNREVDWLKNQQDASANDVSSWQIVSYGKKVAKVNASNERQALQKFFVQNKIDFKNQKLYDVVPAS